MNSHIFGVYASMINEKNHTKDLSSDFRLEDSQDDLEYFAEKQIESSDLKVGYFIEENLLVIQYRLRGIIISTRFYIIEREDLKNNNGGFTKVYLENAINNAINANEEGVDNENEIYDWMEDVKRIILNLYFDRLN